MENHEIASRIRDSHLSNAQKLEDFDFYEFTNDLSASITDQLYRSYLPIVEREYQRRREEERDLNAKGADLEVSHIIAELRKRIDEKLIDQLSDNIVASVTQISSEEISYRGGKRLVHKGWVHVWKTDKFAFFSALASVFLVPVTWVTTFGSSLTYLGSSLASTSLSSLDIISSAHASTNLQASVPGSELKTIIIAVMFIVLVSVLIWALGVLTFSSNKTAIEMAKDSCKTLMGFFIGALTGFLA